MSVEASARRLSFTSYGAVQGFITGSCHVVDYPRNNNRIAFDLGGFQGRNEEIDPDTGRSRNYGEIGYFQGITDVIVSHTHFDHIGRLMQPQIEGFFPRILTVRGSKKILEVNFDDTIKIESRNKRPFYKIMDKERTLRQIREVDIFEEIPIGHKHSELTAEFIPNGHVFGSCSILVRDYQKGGKNILYTGDLGKKDQLICGGYRRFASSFPTDPVDVLVMESTCFRNEPVPFEKRKSDFYTKVNEVLDRGGISVITGLSYHRMHELFEISHNGQKNGFLSDCLVVIDAPLTMKFDDLFRGDLSDDLTNQYGDDLNFYKDLKEKSERFDLNNVRVITKNDDSKNMVEFLNNYKGRAVVFASGGMLEKGRVRNYLDNSKFCQNPRNAFILTCFQAPGTAGERLIKTRSQTTDLAQIIVSRGNTSHASGPEEMMNAVLKNYNIKDGAKIVLVHGSTISQTLMSDEFFARGFPLPERGKFGKKIYLDN